MSVDRDTGSAAWRAEPWPRPYRAVLPAQDPFFAAPEGFESAEPGAVLRHREVEVALFGTIAQQVDAWQLLYRTTDLDDQPQVTVTTILRQHGAVDLDQPLLSYQCAIDAVSERCFPSYALQRGAKAWGAVPQFEFAIVLHALRRDRKSVV